MLNAEIISIGDELLIGQVVNTNAPFIAEQLNLIGINVSRIITIADKSEDILQSLSESLLRSNIILLTGGLGPTKDDITKQTLCDFFNTKLIFNQISYENIQRFFQKRGIEVTEINRKQAEIPENCTPIQNILGTAPCMWFEQDGKILISLPGVPFEMKNLMNQEIIPRLKELSNGVIIHKTILTSGIGESFLSEKISDWEDNLPSYINLAYLPQPGIIRLRLTAKGNDEKFLEQEIKNQISNLLPNIKDWFFGYDNDTIEKVIGEILIDKNLTISTAESCTGGYLAHLITSVSGSSSYYKGSVIAYSNKAKENILNVSSDDIAKYGAVSEIVVKQMAEGAKIKFNTDIAIATSGVAGPNGGTPEKPVGTIWIALCINEKTIAKQFVFGDDRQRNIHRASVATLMMLREILL